MMTVKHYLRRLLWKTGYDLARFSAEDHPVARLQRLFESYGIDTVLDVGANTGQFARFLRTDVGYKGRVVSFEPLSSAYAILEATARRDPQWETVNCALGDADEKTEINIAGNSYSSSLLDMLPSHVESAPESVYAGKESIEVRRLDSIFNKLCHESRSIYLKIDTQGFESRVLRGAAHSLPRINSVQLEMSLLPLYSGEMLFADLYGIMQGLGYSLVAIIPGFTDPASGQLLQVDGVFHRLE